MKRPGPFIVCCQLIALAIAVVPARAQLRIEAPGGVAAQSIKNSPITIYQKDPEALKLLAQMLDRSEADRKAAEQKASELARQLDLSNVTGQTVLGFLRVLARQPNLSLDQVPGKMAEITAGYLQMQERIASLDTEDTAASELARQAAEAGRSGRFEAADRLLEQAEARETEAIDKHRVKAAQFRAARGDNAQAQLHYADAAHHYEAAASDLPESEAGSSVIYILEAGDMWEIAGSTDGALRCYRKALSIVGRLAKTSPADAVWQRDLSVSYNKVGDVQQAQGDLAASLRSYQQALAIAERLAKADPGNAGWQRDLSVSYDNVGDVQQAQGDLAASLRSHQEALAIAERLAKADPGNAGWQRDLSVSYNKVGDVQQAQGDLAASLLSYQEALAIRERLAKADPGNAGWQRDLSVSYERVGDVQQARGDLAASLLSYQQALAIRERLAKADPGNAGWQRDLALSYGRVGATDVLAKYSQIALDSYHKGRDILVQLLKRSPDMAVLKTDIRWFDAQIAKVTLAESAGSSKP